jgi:hypothetical protein
MEPSRKTAIYKLAPGCTFSVRNPSTDAEIVNWIDNGTGTTQPTEEAIQAELDKQNLEYSKALYSRNRAESFPELKEQLDLLFHDMTAGKGTKDGEFYKAISKVKTDNPKPE